ncbi:MAG: hypothetical protein KOO63_12610 [Bacteroidales bacterium]|nr:hypothetical protein [Candidatus Latescibacterota bacterium]
MARNYSSIKIFISILFLLLIPSLVCSAQISQTHGTLQKSIDAGSWGYDTGPLGGELAGIGFYVRAAIGVGGNVLSVEESGQVRIETSDEEMWFSGSSGHISQNFGAEAGVQAWLVILGTQYQIAIPYVGYRDFMLSDDVYFTPYSLGQSQILQASVPRQELICAGIGIPWVASGEICLDGDAGNRFSLRGSRISTSEGNIYSNYEHIDTDLDCGSFSVSNIRKTWSFSGTATFSFYAVFQITIFGIQYEYPINIIRDYALPLDQWISGSFVTDPARSVTFTVPCQTLSVYKSGEGRAEIDGIVRNLPWSGSFVRDKRICLEALPSNCYEFDHWSGSLSSTSRVVCLDMNTNRSLTANFDFKEVGSPNISGLPGDVCGGDRYSLNASTSGATSYSWTSSCGGSFNSPSSASTYWTAPEGYSGQCRISVTASNSCDSNSDDANTYIDQEPGTPSISGINETCGDDVVQFSASCSGDPTSWNWSSSCGGTFSNPHSSSTNWTAPVSFEGSCTIRVTAINDCGESTAGTKSITVTQEPREVTIVGPTSVCGGSQSQYSVNASGSPTSFSWSSSCGGTFTNPNGSTTFWTPPSGYEGSCQISVLASNDCGSSSSSLPITVGQGPGTPIISGPSEACGGTGIQLTATSTGNPEDWSWSSSCGGSFSPTNSNITTWTPPPTINYGDVCQISVRASNECGTSDKGSKSITVNKAPGTLTVTLNKYECCTNDPVLISWIAIPTSTSYRLYANGVEVIPGPGLSTSFTVHPAVTTAYTVSACNDNCGCGDESTPAQVTVHDTPDIPSNLSVSPNPYDCINPPPSLQINWASIQDASGYQLYIDGIPEGGVVSANNTSVSPPQTGRYTISSINDCGESDPSQPVDVNAIGAPDPPDQLSTSEDTICIGSQVIVSWAAVQGASSYKLFADGEEITPGPSSNTSLVLIPDKSTEYTVSSCSDNCGCSNPSDACSVIVMTAPEKPSNLGVTPNPYDCDSTLTVSWDAISSATGYQLYINNSPFNSVLTTPYTYIHPPRAGNYSVAAINDCGESVRSDVVVVISDCNECILPEQTVIIDHFLLVTTMTPEQMDCIDLMGNSNGYCDIGDLRFLIINDFLSVEYQEYLEIMRINREENID